MITEQTAKDWQTTLKNAITDPRELCRMLDLKISELPGAEELSREFPLYVTEPFVRRMRRRDLQDPLLLQIFPDIRELSDEIFLLEDPLNEHSFNPLPGIVHKYADRLLLILTQACPVHCRYCFRRHFNYRGNSAFSDLDQALSYISDNTGLREIIFSGGDPLVLKDEQLANTCNRLEIIPHIRRLRIHTRMPIMIPSRVDQGLLAWLEATSLDVVVVIHTNHPREIDNEVAVALRDLRAAGVTVLNQSVLLHKINDKAEILAELHEKLFACGTIPYYLHLPDPVRGTGHWQIGEKQGRRLLAEVAALQSGYLVPRLVKEIPAMASKIIVAPLY